MDGVNNFFTAEAGLFVRNLKFFSNIENIHINRQLADLLRDAIFTIQMLFEKAEVMDTPEQSVINLIFGFDERQYCLRRFLECRSCCELIALSVDEFEAHTQRKHQNASQNISSSLFSPEISPEVHLSVYQNKMATATCYEVDQNENCVTQCSDDGDAEPVNPKYSDVIINNAPTKGFSRSTSSPSTIHSSDDQSECQARDISVDSGYETSYLIKVRGLPWTTTKHELRDFFVNVQISNELDGIHFITDDQNNFGVAYIQLPTRKDYDRVQTFHRKKLGDRYIEVLKANKQDFVALGDIQKYSDDDNVLRLEGLPWNSKENEIRQFFHDLKIDGIGLILDETTSHTLEAFVRFATGDDFDMALKRNWDIIGNRHVKIFRSSEHQMNLRLNSDKKRRMTAEVKEMHANVDIKMPKHALNQSTLISLPIEKVVEKKSQKDEWQRVGSRRSKSDSKKGSTNGFYMVLARGFQWKVTKRDVFSFFKGIKILNGENGINIIKNVAMEAYIELTSKADVKKALELNNKSVDSRTIRITEVDSNEYANVASCISQTNESKVVQVRGLPWTVDKAYIMKLFPSLKIPKDHIQIEVDENNRRTGYAFVEFDTIDEYDAAFKTDFTAINKFIKLFKATKDQYLRTAATYNSLNKILKSKN